MDPIIVYTLLSGLTCLVLGTTFGFVLGVASRLFFRYGIKEFMCNEQVAAEENIGRQAQAAANHAQAMVAGAHAQAAEIYKAAAAEALKAGVKNIVVPPSNKLN